MLTGVAGIRSGYSISCDILLVMLRCASLGCFLQDEVNNTCLQLTDVLVSWYYGSRTATVTPGSSPDDFTHCPEAGGVNGSCWPLIPASPSHRRHLADDISPEVADVLVSCCILQQPRGPGGFDPTHLQALQTHPNSQVMEMNQHTFLQHELMVAVWMPKPRRTLGMKHEWALFRQRLAEGLMHMHAQLTERTIQHV
ncbi:hypothetical protein J6590_096271 [Homalodisca vitripennis]|nr:hypothetical protein J6590_031355 [Homalodisca vitripennis]KAG8334185.1 hypothetical protein J6590_096271 [Homalodisca vitripennis]